MSLLQVDENVDPQFVEFEFAADGSNSVPKSGFNF